MKSWLQPVTRLISLSANARGGDKAWRERERDALAVAPVVGKPPDTSSSAFKLWPSDTPSCTLKF